MKKKKKKKKKTSKNIYVPNKFPNKFFIFTI